MIDDLGGVTSAVARAALDAAIVRHDIIANNIANASTPGFVPKALRFDDYMAAVKAELLGGSRAAGSAYGTSSLLSPGDAQWQRSLNTESVRLDMEMVAMSENVVRYQAILGALQKRGDIFGMAVRGARA